MNATVGNQLISVTPDELRFNFELEKQAFCDLKVLNNTEHNIAFKVKTTSPKKYFVRPNTGVIQPWDLCIIRVTLQAQQEYPPDMQCKDKFLLQSTIVGQITDVDELPQETFTKESGNAIEECKLRVVYVTNTSASEEEASKGTAPKNDSNSVLQQLKEERDAATKQTVQLKQELDLLKRQRKRSDPSFSLTFAIVVGLIGLILGWFFKLSFGRSSSPSPAEFAPPAEFTPPAEFVPSTE